MYSKPFIALITISFEVVKTKFLDSSGDAKKARGDQSFLWVVVQQLFSELTGKISFLYTIRWVWLTFLVKVVM